MEKRFSRLVRCAGLALLIAVLLAPQAGSLRAQAGAVRAPGAPGRSSVAVAQAAPLPGVPDVVVQSPPAVKGGYPKLESQLAQLYQSAVLGTGRSPEIFAGQDHVDLAAGTARVILEMDVDPGAHQTGPAWIETVTLDDGRTAQIEHAPPTAVRPDLAAAIAAAGATFELGVEDLVQVLAPFSSLKALAEIPGVRRVRLPLPAQAQDLPARAGAAEAVAVDAAPEVGAYTSQGVSLTGIGAWHASPYLQDGTDVNLAVFDFGFTGWATRQSAGDLPSSTYLVQKDYSSAYSFSPDTSGYTHGTACAEIAYDMAPGTGQSPTTKRVYLYAWGTDAEFVQAVDDFKGTGITGKKVATMSISWVNAGPYDGTGTTTGPDAKVNEAAAAGVFWANAMGNYQTQHYSWTSAQYSAGETVAFGTGNIEGIGPTPGTVWNIPANTNVRFFLEWNDWNAGRTGNQNHVDYDLLLYRWTGTAWALVSGSYANQCTSSVAPVEAISYTSASTRNYGLVIQRDIAGCTNNFGHWMQLFTFNGFWTSGVGADNAFWYVNNCSSLTIPADADGAVACGATFWNEDTNPTYNYGLETFSSFGPRNASGGGNPGTAVNKPSVVAPDGVSTATSGASNGVPYRTTGYAGFFGTSAAAPHVAGFAASLWERCSTCTLAQLRNLVEEWSSYKGNGGTCGGSLGGDSAPQSLVQNNRFGWGRISVGSPTSVVLKRFEAWPEGAAMQVQWETVEEIDNTGFNLYRSATRTGPKYKLNPALIPTQVPPGSPFGAVYDLIDTRVRPGRLYFYWLEDVDVYGHTALHGPVRVRMP